MSLQLVADSSCDLPNDYISKYCVDIVPYMISFGDDNYQKEFCELTNEVFYKTLLEKECRPRTSMPGVSEYFNCFKEHAEGGKDIVCVCLTSKFSGSYNGACIAAKQIREKYKGINIEVIDSTTASIMEGALAIKIAEMRDCGLPFSEIIERANKIKESAGAFVMPDTFVYLQRGGRIGKASSIAGDFLNIKAIIRIGEGELLPYAKVRTRKKALDKLIESVIEFTKDYDKSKTRYFLLHAEAKEEAKLIGESFTKATGYVFDEEPFYFGCTIGAHIGPGAIGIGYIEG